MKVTVFSTRSYDRDSFIEANDAAGRPHELEFLAAHLDRTTAQLALGAPAVSPFVNDHVSREVLEQLARGGTRLIALRSAGFNNVDLEAAEELGLKVARVPAYSPWAVAEHDVALMLPLNRK